MGWFNFKQANPTSGISSLVISEVESIKKGLQQIRVCLTEKSQVIDCRQVVQFRFRPNEL